jgi:hypothetical protein
MTLASRMVTRRALLGAGVDALAGCGPPEEPAVVPSEVWGEQLRAAQTTYSAYASVRGVNDLRARARARVRRLQPLAPAQPAIARAAGLDAALEAERAELRAHVAAVGLLTDRPSRELLADLIADGAQSETALLMKLGRQPVAVDFVGQTNR